MENNVDVTLETERLILRDLRDDDWQVVHEYASDPEVVKFMPFGPDTEEETKAFIGRTLAHQKEQPRTHFNLALINKSNNKLIGSCAVSIESTENKEGDLG